MPYALDQVTGIVPPGHTKEVFEHFFGMGDALPPWLQVTAGTGSFVPASDTSPGLYRVTSGATIGDAAELAIIPTSGGDLHPKMYAGIMVEWLGLAFDNAGVSTLAADLLVACSNSGGTAAGFEFHQTALESTFMFEIAGVSSPRPVRNAIRQNAEGFRRRTVGTLWYPQDKQAVLFEGVPAAERATRSSADLSANARVRPRVRVTTREAAAKSIYLIGVRLTRWVN